MTFYNILKELPQFVETELIEPRTQGLLNVLSGCFVTMDTRSVSTGIFTSKQETTGNLYVTFQHKGSYSGYSDANDHGAVLKGKALEKFVRTMKMQARTLSA